MRKPTGFTKDSRSVHFCRNCQTYISRVYLGKPKDGVVTWIGHCECSKWRIVKEPK